jgi:sialate O-acetylesterase
MVTFKKTIHVCIGILTLVLIGCTAPEPSAENISLPSIFSDHAVLQRGAKIPVWGTADPGGIVKVEFAKKSRTTTVNGDGKWMVHMPSRKAGGPYEMRVIGLDTISIKDLLVGEVWLCSGQSNMEWQVRNAMNAQQEIDSADYPEIRMFTVDRAVSDTPPDDCSGSWKVCTPETAGDFSAVGYFFGRHLHQQLDVPVGLIHSSWGGTPAEAWTSFETLESDTVLLPILERYRQSIENYPERLAEYREIIRKIEESGDRLPMYHKDPGNKGAEKGWAEPGFDDRQWQDFPVPGFWENQPGMNIDGAVWFRKVVRIPESWVGKTLRLSLGAIDDFDVTYFNGVLVGATGEETPNFWIHQRHYPVPANVVNLTEALIAVRVFDHYGQGGFAGAGSNMRLSLAVCASDEFIRLDGIWKMKVELALDPLAITGPGSQGLPPEPIGPGHSHSPAGLYHAMLTPLAPYAIRGAIWYQGETNAGRAYQYRTLLPAMINDWRELWKQREFPFGVVQLANFMPVSEEPQESDWAELREAQLLTSLNDPDVGLAVTIDIGETDDIHPGNKQDVGKRLSLWALAKVYGFDLEYSGPLFDSMEIEGDTIFISFRHAENGLIVKGDTLYGFSIAGDDYQFVWANAEIKGNKVLIWSDKIDNPVAVRYAWADNPVCNLYNSEMLPAIPFRTDDKPGITFLSR